MNQKTKDSMKHCMPRGWCIQTSIYPKMPKTARPPDKKSQARSHVPRMPGLICRDPPEMLRAAVPRPVSVFDIYIESIGASWAHWAYLVQRRIGPIGSIGSVGPCRTVGPSRPLWPISALPFRPSGPKWFHVFSVNLSTQKFNKI